MDSTAGKAPFLGTYISHENVPIDALCAQVAALSGLTAIQVRAILEGSFDAIADLEKDGLVIVHLDGMSVWAALTGSFPSADAPFDPERNALELSIRLDDSLRLALVNETAQMVTDADLTKVRLDNIKDLEVERPVNLIHGRHPFRAAGVNLVLSDAGARAYLKGRSGTEHAVVIDEVHSNQLFTAHTEELLEGGDYTLWVESRGGDAEGPLQRDGCRVKYLRVEDPAPELTKIYSFQHEDDTEHLYDGSSAIMEGSALGGATLKFQANSSGTWSEEIAVPSDEFEVTGTKITVDGMWLGDECATLDVGYTDPVRFIVTTPNGTAMIASVWSENA